MIRKIVIVLPLLVLGTNSYASVSAKTIANNSNADFQNYLNYADSLKGQVKEISRSFKPEDNIKGYTPNPEQTKFYGGVTKTTDRELKFAVTETAPKEVSSSGVINAFKIRPVFQIDPQSPGMGKSDIIQKDSYDISRGISDKYVDCKPTKECKTTYVIQNCNEQTRTLVKSCTKSPNITITTTPYKITTNYSGYIPAVDSNSGIFHSPAEGTITGFSVVLKSNNVWRCHQSYYGYLLETYLSSQYATCGGELGDLSFTNYNLNIPVNVNTQVRFSFAGPSHGIWGSAIYSVVMQETRYKKTATVSWLEDCKDGNANTFTDFCKVNKTTCIQPGGDRYFEGVKVHEDCWQYEITKSCGAASDDNCKALRSQSCAQLSSKCRIKLGDICVVQDETYSCPVKTCSDTDGIACGSTFFCMNGDCSTHVPVKNQNFGKDIAEFAAVSAAAADVRDQGTMDPHVFSGKPMECSIDALGAKDCCKDKGWAKDLILNCSKDEEELGKAKEKGLVIEAGDGSNNKYCHNKPLDAACTSYHKVYCVFPNPLAKIIQIEGRKKQLGKNFGHIGDDNKDVHPDCSGITIDELQKLNFDKIDFSPMYDEIKSNMHIPDENKIDASIKKRIKEFYDNKKKHS